MTSDDFEVNNADLAGYMQATGGIRAFPPAMAEPTYGTYS
jgi:hypothetical protein